MILDVISGGGGGGGTTIVQKPTISGNSFTYDGTPKSPTITWATGTEKYCVVTNTEKTNAGTYTLTIALKNSSKMVWNDLTTADITYEYTIAKATLTVPTVEDTSKTYNGSAQHPTVTGYDSDTMSRTGYEYTNAGSYTLAFSLVDSDNYEWDSVTTSFSWSIAKATITLPAVTNTSKTYNGSSQSPTIASYDSTKLSVSGDSATNAGSYTVVFSLVDSDNYVMSGTNNVAWSIAKATLTVPTVSGSYTYDGTQKTCTITGFDSDTMTKSGTESATNAGSYTVNFGLVDSDNYQYATTPSGTWSIGKANQTISLSTSSVALNTSNPTATVTVNGVNTSLSASSNNTSVATVSVSGNTVTISGVNQTNGSATITIYAVSSSNYNQSSSKTVSVTANFYSFPADWLTSGGLNPSSYANLSAVLADEKAVRRLFTIHASVDHLIAHKSQIGTTNLTTILSNNYVAKWINLRDYALDTLYADTTMKSIMDTADKYFYGEWALIDNTWQPKGNVPVMTSNTAPYGEASCSSSSGTDTIAYHAFDGIEDHDHRWTSNTSSGVTSWLQYKFINPIKVKRAWTWLRKNVTVIVKGSNDGTNFDDLVTKTFTAPSGQDYYNVTIDIPSNKQNYYLYYRMQYTMADSGYSAIVYEMQFYGRELKVSVPAMTSNTAPYGVVSANSSRTENPPYKAFDGTDVTSSGWASNIKPGVGDWLCYKFDIPMVLKCFYVHMHAYQYYPTSYKLQASNDGSNWIDIATYSDGANDAKIVHDVSNSTAYQYYRLYSLVMNKDKETCYHAVNFFGLDYSEYDWDTTNPRHYIYDHGVELENLGTPLYVGSTVRKDPSQLYAKINAAQNSYAFAPVQSIDVSSYSLMMSRVGNIFYYNSGANSGRELLKAQRSYTYSDSTDIAGNLYTSSLVASEGTNPISVDISSVNQSCYPMIADGTSDTNRCLTIQEWWLE